MRSNNASPAAAPPESFYWYDLETSGTHPASDRIMQFAGCRTDMALREIDAPYVTYIRLAPDVLPSPEACLVTGISPQRANTLGVDEWQALRQIDQQMRQPNTCVTGYNNLRFDDDFLRHGFYRNLMDPYAREWQDGNSRWDLIDLVRAAYALRPDGIHWPQEDGVATFRLDRLSIANGIPHDGPHDALADVQASIGLARCIKAAQPKLWDYAFAHRSRDAARRLLLPLGERACIHVSQRFSNERYCAAPVVSVALHPSIAARLVVADLSRDVDMLIECDTQELAERLFATEADANERPPLKVVVTNRCPFVAPLNVVRPADAKRLGFDFDAIERRRSALAAAPNLAEKVAAIYDQDDGRDAPADAEFALFDGFVDDADRRASEHLHTALANGAGAWPPFNPRDQRLRVLGERLKARLRQNDLDADERTRWHAHVRGCMADGFGRRPSLEQYRQQVADLEAGATDARQQQLLQELAAYQPELP